VILQLPYQAGWQDLKDLFRTAGNIIRADINIGADGRPKGSGTVVFETPKDAQQAISKSNPFHTLRPNCDPKLVGMYHGFDWYGRTLEVREV
jgi:RNA recognition motif-containing protein